MRKYIYSLLILIVCTLFIVGCDKQTYELTKSGLYFDTAVTLTVYDSDENKMQKALSNAFALCEKYENMFDKNKEGSDIYNINHANGEWTYVSDETIKVLHTALDYCSFSQGHIDITIAPTKELWSFENESHRSNAPDKGSIEASLYHVDYQQIEINGNAVRLNLNTQSIDLGFIAKGFIADEIKAYFISQDIQAALIDLGGNIMVLGEKPDHTPFKIGIKKPFSESGEIITSVEASDALQMNTVVTSGVYERYFYDQDVLYHHIIDAHTGYPVDNGLYAVTILTNSSIHADALSTTCMVMGLDWSIAELNKLDGVDAIFITSDYEIIDTRNND